MVQDAAHCTAQRYASSATAASTAASKSTTKPAVCLCCRFLPDGLFLPPSVFTTSSLERLDTNTNSSATTGTGRNTSCNTADMVMHPREAWKRIRQGNCGPLVDTHSHAHLEREQSDSDRDLYHWNGTLHDTAASLPVISLTCAVDPSDWLACLRHTAQSTQRLSALGIHPWYLDSITSPTSGRANVDTDAAEETDASAGATTTTTTTTGRSSEMDNKQGDIGTNELLVSLRMSELDLLLQQHPRCLVGEIGLCKMAKFLRTYPPGKSAALQLQRRVFQHQLQLAAKHQRPVSIHCVQQHGILLDIFKSLWPSCYSTVRDKGSPMVSIRTPAAVPPPPPPAMALHSYTGTAHHVRQLLSWEQHVVRVTPLSLNAPPLLYFGFSHVVNVTMCTSEKSKRQGREAVLAIPRDRLLAESDVHCSQHEALGTAGAVAYLAWALSEPIEVVATIVATNGLRFLNAWTEV